MYPTPHPLPTNPPSKNTSHSPRHLRHQHLTNTHHLRPNNKVRNEPRRESSPSLKIRDSPVHAGFSRVRVSNFVNCKVAGRKPVEVHVVSCIRDSYGDV